MGFLDASGDITLDVVLTDLGRMRLAKGDGSFKITKFSLADDEINYSLYNYSHSSGSAYYDLAILQTPVLEAFANNGSSMKSLLMSIPRNNLLYLPVLKLNEVAEDSVKMHSGGTFYVACDQDTEEAFGLSSVTQGIMRGETLGGSYIRLDQGLDTEEISYAFTIDADLLETQYIIEIDDRFGKIVSQENGVVAKKSYVDDDQIASYFITLGTDPQFVTENTNRANSNGEAIAGPRGTTLKFRIQSSLDLNTSTYLYGLLGTTGVAGTDSAFGIGSGYTVNYIDTTAKITGLTTGCTTYIPVRFVKVS